MADRLAEVRVQNRLVTMPEGAHSIGNVAPDEQDRIYQEATMFLRSKIEPAQN